MHELERLTSRRNSTTTTTTSCCCNNNNLRTMSTASNPPHETRSSKIISMKTVFEILATLITIVCLCDARIDDLNQSNHHQDHLDSNHLSTTHSMHVITRNISVAANGKKGPSTHGTQNLSKLHSYLNERQQELVKQHPGSLLAVARALKMAIVECQSQMRHEPWDCPIYGFGVKPVDIFGRSMSRGFKETSFVHSLLSAAITHSVTRACTQSMIVCGKRKPTRDDGLAEDIDFGRQFARQFMAATHEFSTGPLNFDPRNSTISNNIVSAANTKIEHHQNLRNHHTPVPFPSDPNTAIEPSKREKIRNYINAHNDNAGSLVSKPAATCCRLESSFLSHVNAFSLSHNFKGNNK